MSNTDDPAMAELEKDFFAQVQAARQSVDTRQQQEEAEAVLDTTLGGVDVDSLLSSVMSNADGRGGAGEKSDDASKKGASVEEAPSSQESAKPAEARPSGRTGWVVSVAARDAKPVKDELRDKNWLDRKVKVAKEAGPNGEVCSFRLVAGCDVSCIQAAIEAGGPLAGSMLRQIDLASETTEQKPAQNRGAHGKKPNKPASKQPSLWRAAELPGGADASQGMDYIKLYGSARAAAGPSPPPPLPAAPRRCGSAIPRVQFESKEQVQGLIRLAEPFILAGLDLGPCVGLWDAPYLAAKAAARRMSAGVHVCPRRTVDLAGHRRPNTPKNFQFVEMPFAEFVRRCSPQSFPDSAPLAPVLADGERLYLRSVAEGPEAAKKASHLEEVFPEIAPDVRLPAGVVYEPAAYFSSVLRMASGDTQLWTHYDTMHNILIQVTGRKRAVLWPPSEHDNLYTEGSSSRVPDIDDPDLGRFPRFAQTWASRLEGDLGPGDALFIPGLWFHHVTMPAFSVAVNVFWRDLDPGRYSRKDLYGNRDLIVAQHAVAAGLRALTLWRVGWSLAALKAAALLADLPQPYRGFYGRRAAAALERATGAKASDEEAAGAGGGREGGAVGGAAGGGGSEERSEEAAAAAAVGGASGGGGGGRQEGDGSGEERTCVVTGAASGIGWEVALQLARRGAQVVMGCRDEGRGALAAAAIRGIAGNERVWVEGVDLASAEAIREFGRRVAERYGAVHALVNAAVTAPAEKEETAEGLEVQFSVNVLGYHRVLEALLPALMAGAPARVANLASQYAGHLDLSDLMFQRRPYRAAQAYMQAKQADRMLSWAWAEELPATKVTVNACHPGSVVGTKLAGALGLKAGSHSAAAAAASVVSLALDERWRGCTGAFVVCGAEQECPWQGDPQCRPLLQFLRSLSPPQTP